MSFRHHLALFKDHSCPLLPTIARHCPRLPAKKMSQALVASQSGRKSRGPGRVPRAAPRQHGCTVEQTNHEPRSVLARGASRREFRGFHETRITAFFLRGRARVAPPETAVRTTAPAGKSLFPGSPLFTIVHDCSLLFAIVHLKILFGASLHVSPRGEAKWVRGPSGRGASRAEEEGASRLARAGMLEPYVEHGKQAQRSHGGRIRVLRPSGGETCRLVSRAARSLLRCALWGGYGAAWAAYCSRAGVRAPSAVRCEIPQKWTKSRISERKHEAQRSPRFPSPLGRVPLWRTHNESMLRKENVLY